MPLALYIGKIQAGPDLRNPGPSHLTEFDIGKDISMHDSSSASEDNPSATNRAPELIVLTRLQEKKIVAIAQSNDRALTEIPPSAPKGKSISQEEKSKNVAKETMQRSAEENNSPSPRQAKNTYISKDQINFNFITNVPIASPCSLLATKANRGIGSAITQAQGKARIETNENNEMWRKIAKAVDIAMPVETPGQID